MERAAIKHFDSVDGKAAITGLAISPDGQQLAVWQDGAALVVLIRTCEVLHRFGDGPIEAIAYSPDGKRLAAAARGGRIRVFDAASGKPVESMRDERSGYSTIAWSPDGRAIAAGHYEPQVSLFDVESGRLLRLLDPGVFDDEGRTSVLFSRDASVLASTGYNSIFLWSLRDAFSQKKRVARKKVGVRGYAHLLDASLSPDGRAIAAIAETEGVSAVHVWDIESRKKLGGIRLPNFSTRLAWSTDDSFIAVAEMDGQGVSLWSPATFKPVAIALEDASRYDVSAVAVPPTGRMIIAGTAAGRVVGWDLGA